MSQHQEERSALCPECNQVRGRCEHTEGESMFDTPPVVVDQSEAESS